MKLNISLALYNGKGSMAGIESSEWDSMDILGAVNMKPKDACLKAAKALKEAAVRFELLAEESNPYNADVQDKLNRRKL